MNNHVNASVLLARLLRERNREAEALVYLNRAVQLGVADSTLLIRLWQEIALCQRAVGDLDGYANACFQIEALFPDRDERDISDWGHLAQLLYRVGHYERTREYLEKTMKLRGDDGPTMNGGPRWWYYTLTLWQLGETERSEELFSELDQILSDNPPANLDYYKRIRSEAMRLMGKHSPNRDEQPAASEDL